MAIPSDAYPLATENGTQIRLDVVRPVKIWAIAVPKITGSAIDATILEPNSLYEFHSDVECVITFDTVAVTNPVGVLGFHLHLDIDKHILTPDVIGGISMIGDVNNGTLFITKLELWQGLAGQSALENR